MYVYEPIGQRSGGAAASQAPAVARRVPVTLVTGYLGSGKTTLIAALMRRDDMAGTAVIVNELAEVGIDQSVIAESASGDVVVLSNGCLCCALGTDLTRAVHRLLDFERPDGQPVTRILIETSGAADPGPIMRQVCFEPLLRSKLYYGGVLCLFDGAFGEGLLERDPVGYRQIGMADMILITKTDMIGADRLKRHRDKLRLLNAVTVITSDQARATRFLAGDEAVVGKAGGPAWLGSTAEEVTVVHHAAIGTWTIRADAPIDWQRTEQRLRITFDRHGDSVLRTKGLIWTSDDPRPLVIHGINRHFHRPMRLRAWEAAPRSQIVVIGFAEAARAADEIALAMDGTYSAAAGPA